MRFKLGVDVGGTFTDFLLVSGEGDSWIHKTLSTPEDPSEGVLKGIYELADRAGKPVEELVPSIDTIVHGTTVATNALLTREGAKTGLVTTRGFRDALEMRRGIREEQYNNRYQNVKPLVPRYLRIGVDERVDAEGAVLEEISEDKLQPAIEAFKKEGVEAVAVCFMNAYKNGANEQKAAQLLREKLPGTFITASAELLPSVRFYERVSTTVVNSFIGPVVSRYLDRLTGKLNQVNFSGALLIMQSNGGVVSPEVVREFPGVTVLSGPAAAPTAGAFYANLLGYKDCITVDMGGTSFDASIVIDNQCVTSTAGSIDRYRIALPSLDIETIGAGGGSIGWIDRGGLLRMGPRSAGADPGPVCYGRGGTQPACTDANLVLGYFNPNFFAGGKIRLDTKKAEQAIEKNLGRNLDLPVKEAASGMYRLINTNMAQGVRKITIERGHDPRDFLVMVAGGAGPVHAGEICNELEIPFFVVPNESSILCAAGMLLGDLKHDYIRSYLTPLDKLDKSKFLRIYDKMKEQGVNTLLSEGISRDRIKLLPGLDLRYIGQYHEVEFYVPWETVRDFDLDNIKSYFHREHNRLFGYSLEDEGTGMELINVRLRAIGSTEKPDFLSQTHQKLALSKALKEEREVFVPEAGEFRSVPVYDGEAGLNGNVIEGPAVIERVNSSILVSQKYDCLVDEYGAFIVYDKEKFPGGFKNEALAGMEHK